MKTLCIVSCGKAKIWDKHPEAGPTLAENVYVGPFARTCRQYAMAFYPTAWCILSARHGFLRPDDTVPGPYDETFKENMSAEVLSVPALQAQAHAKQLDRYEQIVVIGGRKYSHVVKVVFPDRPVREPLARVGGIGRMIGLLKRALTGSQPL